MSYLPELLPFRGCGGKTVEVDKLITYTESGASVYGNLGVTLNEEAIKTFKEENVVRVDNVSDPKKVSMALEQEARIDSFLNSVKLESDAENGTLKNGDKVHVKIHYNPEVLEIMGTKLNKTQTEYTLKSLKEPQNVDPFPELTVTYSGISGLGQAQPSEVALPLPVTFSVSKQTGLKNGDNIKVTASYDDAAAKRSGYIVTQKEKEFTVSGLTEPETVNIFEAAPITFTGISGAGEMTVDSKNLKFPVSIKADKETGLENGDVVTVTAQADPNDLLSKGYILAETTRTVTVEGLTEPQNYDVFQNIVT